MNAADRHPHAQQGTSFIEMVILIVTVGVILSGLTAAVGAGLVSPGSMVRVTQATQYLNQGLEELAAIRRAEGFAALPGSSSATLADGFTRTTTLTEETGPTCPNPAAGACRLYSLVVLRDGVTLARASYLVIDHD
ncbi:MAG: hypothetical protein HQL82_17235 [Magnetococcales bacterium]|nr:hypothetical protein [Magnetococcales bacterium]